MDCFATLVYTYEATKPILHYLHVLNAHNLFKS